MFKTLIASLAFFLSAEVCNAQEKVFHFHEEGEKQWNYAQAYRSGNLLFISGTVGKGTMEEAVTRVYDTLGKTLEKYGLDFNHVVKEGLFTTNMLAMQNAQPIRQKYYGTHTPAATWVEIKRLFDEDSILEVELIAEIEKQ
ncbi:RidA family protein [Algoriphagus sp. CAU 1675]|uniref:RidA family protein n=1 Tax=Algoriphagus sp. CAU 1675 TaxID=3032597 RepID=UPI0023DA89AF|nr:RidA family protein [Algoriphagus sp. CAU 1675]MDF2157040.1 RidA family protein [Algoriphagus sp. CAU 1675]